MTRNPEAVVCAEVDRLVEEGDEWVRRVRALGPGDLLQGPELAGYSSWVTRLGHTVRKVFGTEGQHYSSFEAHLEEDRVYAVSRGNSSLPAFAGIARAMQHDIALGHLPDVRSLVRADVFADFLEMAEYLLDEGYKDPAAVLVGGVLQDHLRNLAIARGLSTHTTKDGKQLPKKADQLNADVARAGAYGKLDQKSVTSWLDLRNKAAHGRYGEYTNAQVGLMLQGVLDFLVRVPG